MKSSGLLLCGTLIWGVVCSPAQGGDAPLACDPVRSLIQEGSYRGALDLLDQGVPWRDPFFYRFQRAYCLQRLERWPEAAILYEGLLENPSPIEDYVHDYLSECYARQELWQLAAEQAREVLADPQSLLEASARELLAHSLLNLGRVEESIEVFQDLAARSELRARRPVFWLSMGRAHQRAGRDGKAVQLFAEILDAYPASQEAEEALQALKSIRQAPLAGEELFDSAWVQYHSRRYLRAAAEWGRFSEDCGDPNRAAEALYLSARANHHGKRHTQAEASCERLLRLYPKSRWATSARYLLARIAEGEGDIGLARRRLRQFAADFSWSQLADDALWRLAQTQECDGDLQAAVEEYLALSDLYSSRERGWKALRKAGLLLFLVGENDRAIEVFELFRRRYPDGAWALGSRYWEARAHIRAGRRGTGRLLLKDLIARDRYGYYGCRARGRLRSPDEPVASDRDTTLWQRLAREVDRAAASEEPGTGPYQKGIMLLRLGLLPQAREELSGVDASPQRKPRLLLDLLRLYEELELSCDALRLAQRMEKQVSGCGWKEALDLLLYPRGYREIVSTMAEEYGLEADLIFSVIRTESHFDPLAVSPAGARGLMQIMPATGDEIAEQLGFLGGVSPSPFRPQWGIRLGSCYLRQQLEDFEGQPERALAAYNAGPGNVRRWLKRWGKEIEAELFVELIDFDETRNFVRKVLSAQARYRRIWGEQG